MNEFRLRLQRFAEEGEPDSAAAGGSIVGGATPAPQTTEPAPQEENAGSAEGAQGGESQKSETGNGAPETYDFKTIVPEGMEYDEKSAG